MEHLSISDAERAAAYGEVRSPKRSSSAVSWGAILAGAIAAAALSIILLMLGVGLGLSSVSPWAGEGVSAATFGVSSILWLTLTQLLASGMGGYLAGRLRTRWAGTDTDEVYFRDTAHGFLAWAVASLATAALLSSAVAGIVGGAAKAGATAGTAIATTAAAGAAGASGTSAGNASAAQALPRGEAGGVAYAVDALFRTSPSSVPSVPPAAPSDAQTPTSAPSSLSTAPNTSTPEVARIFGHSLSSGELSADDARYVAQLVAQRTGLSQADAERRVRENYARVSDAARQAEERAKEAADKARKATAYTTLWTFISLLIGAFVASLCATFGGRQRDATPLPL